MKGQEIQSLFEAYENVYAQQNKETIVEVLEEVEIAAQYFYEMGLNDEGVDILIEDLGLEGFANFVYDIAEEYVLTEARAGGVKIEPKLASGKEIQGKPKAASLKRLRAQKAARQETENKASASKPSGMKASLERQSAVSAAAKKQPKKPGFLDRVVGAVDAGIKRHNAFMSAAKETGKTIRKAAGKVGDVAKEVGKGASGAAKLAGHVARKGLSDEYLMGYLIDEGYADTEDAALAILENMSGEWREEILDEATIRSVTSPSGKRIYKSPEYSSDERTNIRKTTHQQKRLKQRHYADGSDARNSQRSFDDEERRENMRRKHPTNIMNAKPGEDEYSTYGADEGDGYHYDTVKTDQKKRKRRASGR